MSISLLNLTPYNITWTWLVCKYSMKHHNQFKIVNKIQKFNELVHCSPCKKTSRNEPNYSNYSLLTAVKFFYSCNFGVVWSVGSLCEVIPISKVMVNIYAEERGKILHCFVFSYFKQINWKVQVFRHANKFKQLVISKKKSFKKHLN